MKCSGHEPAFIVKGQFACAVAPIAGSKSNNKNGWAGYVLTWALLSVLREPCGLNLGFWLAQKMHFRYYYYYYYYYCRFTRVYSR